MDVDQGMGFPIMGLDPIPTNMIPESSDDILAPKKMLSLGCPKLVDEDLEDNVHHISTAAGEYISPPTSSLKVHLPPAAKDLCPGIDLNDNVLGIDVNGNYLEVDVNVDFIGNDVHGILLGDNPNDNIPPDKPLKLARAVPDGQGTAPVNLHGQFPPAESPHNDCNTAGMPKAYNPWTPDNSFFKGGGRKYKWNFVRPPNPNVQITDEMSLSQTHVTGGKE